VIEAVVAAKAVDRALTAGAAGAPVAFLVGMVSFFTPCILPLVPGYLSYMSGLSGETLERGEDRRRVLGATLLFVLGFAIVFTLLGVTASALGVYLNRNQRWIGRIGGAIVIVMGVSFLLPGVFRFMERERRPFLANAPSGVAGAFPLGLAFAIGWTPCVGPGLATILNLAATESSAWHGGVLLFFFSLGFGVWFVLGGLAFRRSMRAIGWLRKRQGVLQLVGGAFLIGIGVLLVTDQWNTVLSPLRRLVNRIPAPI
jgi:cytochrome c-type biogenesis protein